MRCGEGRKLEAHVRREREPFAPVVPAGSAHDGADLVQLVNLGGPWKKRKEKTRE